MDQTVAGVGGLGSSVDRAGSEKADLQQLADQLQGVFIQQLFKAMRDSVPENGGGPGSAGSDMFSGMMDEHLAEAASAQLSRGLGQALYRQLSGKMEYAENMKAPVGESGIVSGTGEEVS